MTGDHVGRIVNDQDVLAGDPSDPAILRRIEGPAAVLEGCDLIALARPRIAGAGRNHVPAAFDGGSRRTCQNPAFNRELHQAIEGADGFVMRDMLLGLGSKNVGQ